MLLSEMVRIYTMYDIEEPWPEFQQYVTITVMTSRFPKLFKGVWIGSVHATTFMLYDFNP